MIVALPVSPDGSWFQFSSELEGITYVFELRWNAREGCWYCTLRDGEGNALVSGRKVVLGSLFRKFRGRPGVMPTGDVYAVDTSGADADPASLSDLGQRVVLLYAPDADLGI